MLCYVKPAAYYYHIIITMSTFNVCLTSLLIHSHCRLDHGRGHEKHTHCLLIKTLQCRQNMVSKKDPS